MTGKLDLAGQAYPDSYSFGEVIYEGERSVYVAVKQGEVFHAVPVCDHGDGWEFWAQTWGYVFGPVHPSVTFADVEGARHAWKDKDGFFHFSHATAAEHHEFADYCAGQALAAVQPILNDRLERYMVATTDGPMQVAARAEFQAWRAFSVRARHHARMYALAEPLGHWDRNRHLHHARNIVGRAMAATLNEWGAARPDASEHNYYQKVRNEALKTSLALQRDPTETITTWPDHREANRPKFADDSGTARAWTRDTAIADVVVPAAKGASVVYSAADLPAGLAFDAGTRTISGTPSAEGTGTITVTAANEHGSDTWTVAYTVAAAGD